MRKRGIGHLNAFRMRFKGWFCVYCGEIAIQDEHFPPVSYSMHGFILPCCAECNVLAGTNYPRDFEARADHVKGRLRVRYGLQVGTPNWSNQEINELGPMLKVEAKKWQKTTKISKERVAWNAISYLASIDQCNDFVPIYVEEDFLEQNKWRWSNKQGKCLKMRSKNNEDVT